MSYGSAATAPPRPVSPARKPFPPRRSSPLNPRSRPELRRTTATGAAVATAPATTTQIQIANLERLLYKPLPAPPSLTVDDPEPNGAGDEHPGGVHGLLNALNLPALMLSSRTAKEEVSPRSLRQLQRLLSDSNRPSPRNTIAPRWRDYHGAGDWAGLLDPLDENLRRELIRYGDLVQSAYQAFNSNPAFRPEHHRAVALPDRSYRVTRSLYATASLELPRWVSGFAPWMAQRSSWVGYVAVCENEREIKRMGRRDIVIALRGTSTCLEWAENLRAGLAPLVEHTPDATKSVAKVEKGFLCLYKTPGSQVPSLSSAVLDEVRRLMELYKGEELSITITGHSLGAALSVLVGEELSRCVPGAPPIAVFSFGGPKVGNRGFADAVERQGVKVLRVVNAKDMVTRVPMAPPLIDGYVDVGAELRVDSRESPYLRPNADPACCHDLEAYLHLVDGFLGKTCPFRADAKRSLARLLCQQGTNVKKLYMSKVRDLDVDPAAVMARSNFSACLPSPSSS